MHIVLTHSTDQSTRSEEVANLIALLEFVDSEWRRFENSSSRTMRAQLTVPSHIRNIIIGGVSYGLAGRKREIWFRRTATGYDSNLFYLSEVTDADGHLWQLFLDRSRGASYDDLVVLRTRRLAANQAAHSRAYSGPRVRD